MHTSESLSQERNKGSFAYTRNIYHVSRKPWKCNLFHATPLPFILNDSISTYSFILLFKLAMLSHTTITKCYFSELPVYFSLHHISPLPPNTYIYISFRSSSLLIEISLRVHHFCPHIFFFLLKSIQGIHSYIQNIHVLHTSQSQDVDEKFVRE